ncbi:nitroreductase family protein [Halobacillus sp. B23F22_1]|uniref:nitroreductase family protein n=1 Tax=Halobacillus sp. B23F22_1 TaxID=3459514 RepID=UPI00373FB90B
MELYEAITSRRSIHDFQQSIVTEEELKQIFQLASWAPTHRMKQPWMVKVFQKEGGEDFAEQVIKSYKRSGFTEGYSKEKAFKMMEGIKNFLVKIPHHALIYMEKDRDMHRYEEDFSAVCAYIQNVQLAAWEKGIGVLWTSSPYIHDETFIDDIGLDKKRHKIIGVLQMGYPSSIPGAKTRNPVPLVFQKDHFTKRS